MRSFSHILRIHLSLLMGMRLAVPRAPAIGKKEPEGALGTRSGGERQGRKIGRARELVQTRRRTRNRREKPVGASLEILPEPRYIRGPEIVKDFTNSAPWRNR